MGADDRLVKIEGLITLETELTDQSKRIRQLNLEDKFYRSVSYQLGWRLLFAKKARLRRTENVRGCYFEPTLISPKVHWRLRLQDIARLLRVRPNAPHLLWKLFVCSPRGRARQQDHNQRKNHSHLWRLDFEDAIRTLVNGFKDCCRGAAQTGIAQNCRRRER